MAAKPTLYATSVDANTIDYGGDEYKFSGKKYFIDGKWQWVFYKTYGNGGIDLRMGILCDTLDLNELTTAKHFDIKNQIYDLTPILGNPPSPSSITPVDLSDKLNFYLGSDFLRDENGDVIYYMWAGTTGQSLTQAKATDWKYFHLSNCPYYDEDKEHFTKYGNYLETLEPTDDAANVLLGDDWHMPTFSELEQIYSEITKGDIVVTTEDNLIKLVNVYTEEYIQIPSTGYIFKGNVSPELICFWSSSLEGETKAFCIQIDSNGNSTIERPERFIGVPVLPVKYKK